MPAGVVRSSNTSARRAPHTHRDLVRQQRGDEGRSESSRVLRVAVVGGAGHVGLPLSLVLATHGSHVTVIDSDRNKIDALKRRELPFKEEGAEELLQALTGPKLVFSSQHEDVAACDIIVLTIFDVAVFKKKAQEIKVVEFIGKNEVYERLMPAVKKCLQTKKIKIQRRGK